MKKLYTVGETAKLLGVSTQTLRFYDRCGLLRPRYVDEKTGYRYYAFNQFHYIDRIKYLQSLGMPLRDIKEIISTGTVDKLVDFLQKQRDEKQREMEDLQSTLDIISWYIDYFTFIGKNDNDKGDLIYSVRLPTRYAISVPGYPSDNPISEMEVRLAAVKSKPELRGLKYLRQYAYLVDYPNLVQKIFSAYCYFIYLKESPNFKTNHFLVLPAGDYLCYRARILTEEWDPSPLREYFVNRPPILVIANELEENLVTYDEAQYELQMLLH